MYKYKIIKKLKEVLIEYYVYTSKLKKEKKEEDVNPIWLAIAEEG